MLCVFNIEMIRHMQVEFHEHAVDGKLSKDQFNVILREHGYQMEEENVDRLFGLFDKDESNQVTYILFMRNVRSQIFGTMLW